MKRNAFKRYVILSAIAVIAPFVLNAQDYYVKVSATGNGDGSSWTNAMGNEAFAQKLLSAQAGSVFHLAEGEYKPYLSASGSTTVSEQRKTFLLRKGVTIKGGYTANGSAHSATDKSRVILSGNVGIAGVKADNAYNVVTVAGGADGASLQNLTVTGGYGNGGGIQSRGAGIYVGENAGTSTHKVIFSYIAVKENSSNDHGSGIFTANGSYVRIENSTVAENRQLPGADIWGGGISVWRNSTVEASNLKVSGNTAAHGGAVHVTKGTYISGNSVYADNSSASHGGAFDIFDGSYVTLSADSIKNNVSGEGGGIHNESGTVNAAGTVFKNNTADGSGGAFLNSGSSVASFTACVFDGNTIKNRGGGIENRNRMEVNRSRIINNTAATGTAWGGGINQNGGRLIIRQCEIAGNSARHGGGFQIEGGTAVISNTTFSGNNASERGGAIDSYSGSLNLIYVTVTGNTAPVSRGSGIRVNNRPGIQNSIISGNANSNDISGNLNSSGTNSSANNIIGSAFYHAGNRADQAADAAFTAAIHLEPLDFNRGVQTRTHKLHWISNSLENPAVGKAAPLGSSTDATYVKDQTGKTRGSKPSLGAYEEDLFKAYDIIVSTDIDEAVTIGLSGKNAIPESCTNPVYTLLPEDSPPPVYGSFSALSGTTLTYTPSAKGTDTLYYRLACGSLTDRARIIVRVRDGDQPDNIKDEEICMEDMHPIQFSVKEKYSNKLSRLDGFSMPVVGDLDGDGKPEVIALGLRSNSDGGGLEGYARYIVVYNGQTGEELLKFDLRGSEVGATEAGFRLRNDTRHNSISKFALVDLDGLRGAELVVTETVSGRVYALKPVYSNDKLTSFAKLWEVSVNHKSPLATGSLARFSSPMPYVTDLNGDGTAEVIVYNKIYNGRTGDLILELETLNHFSRPTTQANVNTYTNNQNANGGGYAYVGRRPSTQYADDAIPAMAIIDIDEDGIMEIVAGSKIYKPNISPNSTSTAGNSFTVIHGPQSVTLPKASGSGTNTYYLSDGYTAVADVDGDGQLDIIVQTTTSNGYDQSYAPLIYVWDMLNPTEVKAAVSFRARSLNGTMSMPFIGDINGRKDDFTGTKTLPEICFNTGIIYDSESYGSPLSYHPLSSAEISANKRFNGSAGLGTGTNSICGHIVGFTYHANPDGSTPIQERLKMSWVMEHGDESAHTGITMFDFDADGVKELVYRDETSLRVISPARKTYIFKNEEVDPINGAIRFKRTSFYSYTGFEAPVIADVNGDGSADLITFANTTSKTASYGNLFVFEADGESWAPARPVWNQGIYYPLQINDDLTVPRRPLSTLTKFVSQRPDQTVADTIQPYNANWVQQPIVRKNNYVPVIFTPDLALEDMRVVSSHTANGLDSMVVRVVVENRGKNTANTNTPITFYHTTTSVDTKLGTVVIPSGIDIYPGERVELDYTIPGNPVGKIIHARLVDDGTDVFPAAGFQDCDPTNNARYTVLVRATDDYFSTFSSNPVKLDITANDSAFCTLTPEIIQSPRFGTAEVTADGKLSYIVAYEYQGKDSLRYVIKCEYNDIVASDTASVYITVGAKPGNIITDPGECIAPVDEIEFTMQRKWRSPDNTADYMSAPLVGDLDGDGIAEIAVLNNNTTNHTINIFDGRDGSTVKAQIVIPAIPQASGWRPAMTAVMVDADSNGKGEIIVVRSDQKIISYEAGVSGGSLAMSQKWTTTLYAEASTGKNKLPHPNIADLNGDGVPELIVCNQVYNATTGAYLGRTEEIAAANIGGVAIKNSDRSSNLQTIADIDGDGILEIVAGGKVYKPHFNEDNTAVTFTKLYENTAIGDGFTSVADVDLDGTLDVVVAKPVSSTVTQLYVWSPVKDVMIDNFQVASNGNMYNGISFPLIGDIDGEVDDMTGKKYPEICVSSANSLLAYKYNASTGKYSKKWTFTTSDESGATGATLFDFDNDGIGELVYRDELKLYIIDGSRDGDPREKASFTCTSATAFEYPAIADVDGDGSADICVTCGSYLVVYESASQPWAPARKVWNQVNYDPLLVNDDLSVPAFPIQKNTVFTVGGAEYRPYNGAFIQVPVTDMNMKPVLAAADPFVVSISAERLDASTVQVSVVVGNQGQANVNSSLPVSLYTDTAEPANLIEKKTIGVALQPGNTATLTFNVPADRIKSQLIVRLQDDGQSFPAEGYYDCNNDNNTMTLQNILALDDHASPEKDKSVDIAVLDNDTLGACTATSIGLAVESDPAYGTAELVGNKIRYTPDAGFVGADSFTYKIICDGQESTATIHIVVNSTLMVEIVRDAAEPDVQGVFRIKFTDNGFTFPKDITVYYTIEGTAADNDYAVTPSAGTVTLSGGTAYVDVAIAPQDNFTVEGNAKDLKLTITGISIAP